jgi:hypothetical protein
MMRNLLAAAVVVALAGGVVVAGELKSGPQAGQKVPGPFHPFNVTGEDAGKEACLYCKHGDSPVAVVFARNPDCPMTRKLIKALDAETAKHQKEEMGSFAVFLAGDKDKVEPTLKAFAEKEMVKTLTLAIEGKEGPNKYNIAKDADVTVVLYFDRQVKANYAFEAGKLTEKDVESIIKDVSKIMPPAK